MRLVDFLSQTNYILRLLLGAKQAIHKQGIQTYIESIMQYSKHIPNSELNKLAEQQMQQIDSLQNTAKVTRILHKLHTTYLGKALTLSASQTCVDDTMQLWNKMQDLDVNEWLILSQVAHENKVTTNEKLKSILQDTWALEDKLYKLYVTHYNLHIQDLQNNNSISPTLQTILHTHLSHLPQKTLKDLQAAITLYNSDNNYTADNIHNILDWLDMDGRVCDIYKHESADHKVKMATSFVPTMAQLMSRVVDYIVPT